MTAVFCRPPGKQRLPDAGINGSNKSKGMLHEYGFVGRYFPVVGGVGEMGAVSANDGRVFAVAQAGNAVSKVIGIAALFGVRLCGKVGGDTVVCGKPRQDVRDAIVTDGSKTLLGVFFRGGVPASVLDDVAEAGRLVINIEQRVAEQADAVGQHEVVTAVAGADKGDAVQDVAVGTQEVGGLAAGKTRLFQDGG